MIRKLSVVDGDVDHSNSLRRYYAIMNDDRGVIRLKNLFKLIRIRYIRDDSDKFRDIKLFNAWKPTVFVA